MAIHYNSNILDHNFVYLLIKSNCILQSIQTILYPMLSNFLHYRVYHFHISSYLYRNKNTYQHLIPPHMEIRQKRYRNVIHMKLHSYLHIYYNRINMKQQNICPDVYSLLHLHNNLPNHPHIGNSLNDDYCQTFPFAVDIDHNPLIDDSIFADTQR